MNDNLICIALHRREIEDWDALASCPWIVMLSGIRYTLVDEKGTVPRREFNETSDFLK